MSENYEQLTMRVPLPDGFELTDAEFDTLQFAIARAAEAMIREIVTKRVS